jgi:hypothetical protein
MVRGERERKEASWRLEKCLLIWDGDVVVSCWREDVGGKMSHLDWLKWGPILLTKEMKSSYWWKIENVDQSKAG